MVISLDFHPGGDLKNPGCLSQSVLWLKGNGSLLRNGVPSLLLLNSCLEPSCLPGALVPAYGLLSQVYKCVQNAPVKTQNKTRTTKEKQPSTVRLSHSLHKRGLYFLTSYCVMKEY